MTFLNRKRVAVILIALVAVILYVIFGIDRIDSQTKSEIEKGKAYLTSLDSKSVEDVENKLKAIRQAKLDAEIESRMQSLTDGTIDVWTLFDDAVVMGDSRAVGFDVFGFLPSERVIAGGGYTIRDIEAGTAQLSNLNPSTVFLCYGLNDVSIGYWESSAEYAAEYKTILEDLNSRFPDTEFYVSSILPAQEAAFAQAEAWRNIPEWSNAVKEMCEQSGYGWVDCDEIVNAHIDLYDPDAIHMQQEFYPYWAARMWTSVYSRELQEDAEGTDSSDDNTSGDQSYEEESYEENYTYEEEY